MAFTGEFGHAEMHDNADSTHRIEDLKSSEGMVKLFRTMSLRKREDVEYDVMIAYRFNSDANNAETMFEISTEGGMKVWMDKKSMDKSIW
jgi:hypothetical protein